MQAAAQTTEQEAPAQPAAIQAQETAPAAGQPAAVPPGTAPVIAAPATHAPGMPLAATGMPAYSATVFQPQPQAGRPVFPMAYPMMTAFPGNAFPGAMMYHTAAQAMQQQQQQIMMAKMWGAMPMWSPMMVMPAQMAAQQHMAVAAAQQQATQAAHGPQTGYTQADVKVLQQHHSAPADSNGRKRGSQAAGLGMPPPPPQEVHVNVSGRISRKVQRHQYLEDEEFEAELLAAAAAANPGRKGRVRHTSTADEQLLQADAPMHDYVPPEALGFDFPIDSDEEDGSGGGSATEPRMAGNRRMRKPMNAVLLRGALQPLLVQEVVDVGGGEVNVTAYAPYAKFQGQLSLVPTFR